MYPHTFADHLRDWLARAEHPGLAQVRTCADIGRWEQPVGVAITLTDGWTFILQCVGTTPNGGNANRDPRFPAPDLLEGSWEDNVNYRTARTLFEKEQRTYTGPRSRQPQASPEALLHLALQVTEGAGVDHIASVEIREKTGSLKVVFADGAAVFGLAAGYIPPSEVKMPHTAHDIPAAWRKEPARVS